MRGCPHYFGHKAFADDAAAAATPPAYVNPINTMWTLVAAFLVFFMQAGFMCLEAGFARTRETVNILLEGIVDTCLCGMLFWAFGFAFMFGAGNGFIGHAVLLPARHARRPTARRASPFLAFWLFQFAFADTCSTITSGAMVGRTGFVGDILYSIGVSRLHLSDHRPLGLGSRRLAQHHHAGRLPRLRRLDGGAHHRRLRRARRRHRARPAPRPQVQARRRRHAAGHDMTIAAVGGVILWFGWYGFNPGSTLSAMDARASAASPPTPRSPRAPAGSSALFYIYPRNKVWDCGITVNGFLAGLVAITCPCYWVSPTGALIIGAVAGVVCVLGRRPRRVAARRRPDRRGPRARRLRHLGHAQPRPLRHRPVRRARRRRAPTTPRRGVTGLFYGGGVTQLTAQVHRQRCVTAARRSRLAR